MTAELPPVQCTCIALNHDHTPSDCERIGKTRGGVCTECNYWSWTHRVEPDEEGTQA